MPTTQLPGTFQSSPSLTHSLQYHIIPQLRLPYSQWLQIDGIIGKKIVVWYTHNKSESWTNQQNIIHNMIFQHIIF